MEQIVLQFSELHRLLAYAAVFLGMFIEGEMILILAGILVKGGVLGFFNTFWIASIAVILHDILYWTIGRKLFKFKKTKFVFFRLEKMEPFFNKFKKREGFYIFSSKFAWNLNRIVLISLGYLGVSIKKILKYSVTAATLWSLTFISLGFIFAEQTDLLKKDLRNVAIFITVFLIFIIILESIFKKIFKKENILKNGNNDIEI